MIAPRHFARYMLIVCSLFFVALLYAIILPTQPVTASGNPMISHIPANIAHLDGVLYVDVEANGARSGSSWTDAFTDLQSALDAAISGDQIWVATGTYTPTVAHGGVEVRYYSFQLKNGVALYAGFDPSVGDVNFADRDWVSNVAILSGDLGVKGNISDNSYHVFYHPDELNLDSTAILDGFTISGGNAEQIGWPHFAGGGMFNEEASPTVNNCTFVDNNAFDYGAGMYNYYASPTVTGCTFLRNVAAIGGGIYNNYTTTVLTDCIFQDNTAGYGGAMYNYYGAVTMNGCSFVNNTATWEDSLGAGGAIYNQTSSPVMTDCSIIGNSAFLDGGGMFNDESSPMLNSCIFSGNTAETNAGALYNRDNSYPKLINTIFADNEAGYYGGGIYNQNSSSPTLINCTFYGNSAQIYEGGAIRNDFGSSATVINSILWGDSPAEISSYDQASAPIITHSDIQGGYSGDGNINLLPYFINPANGNFHLGYLSQCIDSGDNAAPDLPEFDFEGDARILDGNGDGTAIVDMGVDEATSGTIFIHFYLPMVINNS